MVKERVGSLAWLRKRIEQADADLLREMVKTMAETLMPAEVDARCGAPYRRPSADGARRNVFLRGLVATLVRSIFAHQGAINSSEQEGVSVEQLAV